MELAWSRQIGLTASVAAYSIAEDELNRAVLEIEGPGAEIYLSMEHGIHRLHFPRARDSKIRVEILPNIPSKSNFQVDIRTISTLKFTTISTIHHLLDFSDTLCHCCKNFLNLGSNFNQKGERMDGL
jgi:hypothetical protein